MNLKELKELVKQGESDRLEFKKSTGQRTAATKTVCAMLNGMGGFVIFGVTDKGEIKGQQVSAKTIEDLSNEIRNIEPHESKPWNPLIANAFYRAGIIERWGSGTTNIIDRCKENGNPGPHWQERAGAVVVTFFPIAESKAVEVTPQATMEVTPQVTPQVKNLLAICEGEKGRGELQVLLNIKDRKHFRKAYLNSALATGLIKMTIPDKPQSRLQKYRLTAKGKVWLEKDSNKGE